MVLTDLIRTQLYESVIMFACGIGLCIMREAFMILKEHIKKRYIPFAETAFWISAAFFTGDFISYASDGALSFHNFSALLLGVLLWHHVFYDKIKY